MRVQNRLQALHPNLLDQRGDSRLGLVALNLPSTVEVANSAESVKSPLLPQLDDQLKWEESVINECSMPVPAGVTVQREEEMAREMADQSSEPQVVCDVKSEATADVSVCPPCEVEGEESAKMGGLASRRSPRSPSKAIGSSTASPSHYRHTSQSWTGDDRGDAAISLSPKPSSYSTHFPLEHLPPLLSYDEADDNCGRSPRLHGNSDVLSEEEQLTLHASMSDITTSHSDQSDGEHMVLRPLEDCESPLLFFLPLSRSPPCTCTCR